jgi:hypothetical protein
MAQNTAQNWGQSRTLNDRVVRPEGQAIADAPFTARDLLSLFIFFSTERALRLIAP